ncbi:hypothetical protein [Dactylosporangium sp. CA-139066]|uniref:hypothetical protein n=1 Tax=Dactylosporangium sp. CA-139066 TaxID=3239930 RepID=UPI003D908FBF
MSDYTPFSTDLDGNGTEDPAAIYTTDDGSNILVGDLDHDGTVDIAAIDSDGDGVYEQAYDPATGITTDLTDEPDYGAEYDGSGGNLDGDISATADTGDSGDTAAAAPDGGYWDAGAISDMMAMQHETSMAVINNI